MKTEAFKVVAARVLEDLHEEHEALDDFDPEEWAHMFCERFCTAAEDLAE